MSAWEIFTWVNVGILAVGSLVVFALFLRQVRTLLGERPADGAEGVGKAVAAQERGEKSGPASR
jgi:hypothetical protein